MKYNKILRTLAMAIILPLLMVAIPATPALAQSIDYSYPSSGPVGTIVSISGSAFTPGESFTITFYNVTVGFTQIVAFGIIGSGGSFSTPFTVPECPKATYTVQVTSGINTDWAYFTVTP